MDCASGVQMIKMTVLIKSKMIYLGRKEARRDESNDKNKADSDGRIPD